MQTIWKFNLYDRPDSINQIAMPIGAKLVSVGVQGMSICIWALVDTQKPVETRIFELVQTGGEMQEMPQKREFLGTILLNNATYVLHVFEIIHTGNPQL